MSVLSDIPSNTRCEGVHKFVDPRLGCSLGYESSFRKVDQIQANYQFKQFYAILILVLQYWDYALKY